MAAPKNNKYAEKWTEETTLDKINDMFAYVRRKPNEYHLGGVLVESELYPQWWSEMGDKFKESIKVSEAIKRMEGYLEAKIINSTISGDAKFCCYGNILLKE